MAEFKKVETPIEGLFVIEPTVFGDARGFFMETYAKRDFDAMAGSPVDFVQDNHSKSRRGVLRGLHFQTRHAQGKLIRVVGGFMMWRWICGPGVRLTGGGTGWSCRRKTNDSSMFRRGLRTAF